MGFASRALAATNNERMCTVTIVQPANAVITVTIDGLAHTSTFVTPYGSKGQKHCAPNTGYKFVQWQDPEMNTLAENTIVSADVIKETRCEQ